jgi:hypothetical protein
MLQACVVCHVSITERFVHLLQGPQHACPDITALPKSVLSHYIALCGQQKNVTARTSGRTKTSEEIKAVNKSKSFPNNSWILKGEMKCWASILALTFGTT